ncbi:MAG TPA: alpha-ketoacid dehydrogenase subunit beta [Candidatus Dormibacteraeota bacterium]|nr:alpha-ketoacid dehydrogenase subunit beta [Candidatus Dormibacteraeota bacterium]
MAGLTLVESVNGALHAAMDADETVVVMGEDVGRTGGVFRATAGLLDRFGPQRVLDTPLSESGFVGVAIGAALHGLRPVVEIQFDCFVYPAFEQIVLHAARYRWRTGGEAGVPLVLRIPFGGGNRAPDNHSDSPEMLFCHVPGLRVVCPSTPQDAWDMLVAATRADDPVVVMEPKRIYRTEREEVASRLAPGEGALTRAAIRRAGTDVTVIAYGGCVPLALRAADVLGADGVSVEVVDLRSLYPLDESTILDSVRRTGRCVVVHEAPRFGGMGAEVSALVHEELLLHLLAPVQRVGGLDVPFPLMANEADYMPDVARVLAAARRTLDF